MPMDETLGVKALDLGGRTAAVYRLEPYCGEFLYTHVDTEGTLSGLPLDAHGRPSGHDSASQRGGGDYR